MAPAPWSKESCIKSGRDGWSGDGWSKVSRAGNRACKPNDNNQSYTVCKCGHCISDRLLLLLRHGEWAGCGKHLFPCDLEGSSLPAFADGTGTQSLMKPVLPQSRRPPVCAPYAELPSGSRKEASPADPEPLEFDIGEVHLDSGWEFSEWALALELARRGRTGAHRACEPPKSAVGPEPESARVGPASVCQLEKASALDGRGRGFGRLSLAPGAAQSLDAGARSSAPLFNVPVGLENVNRPYLSSRMEGAIRVPLDGLPGCSRALAWRLGQRGGLGARGSLFVSPDNAKAVEGPGPFKWGGAGLQLESNLENTGALIPEEFGQAPPESLFPEASLGRAKGVVDSLKQSVPRAGLSVIAEGATCISAVAAGLTRAESRLRRSASLCFLAVPVARATGFISAPGWSCDQCGKFSAKTHSGDLARLRRGSWATQPVRTGIVSCQPDGRSRSPWKGADEANVDCPRERYTVEGQRGRQRGRRCHHQRGRRPRPRRRPLAAWPLEGMRVTRADGRGTQHFTLHWDPHSQRLQWGTHGRLWLGAPPRPSAPAVVSKWV
ncbi:unnamed protein product, partial [Prorocentrum cordatum]